MFRAGPQNCSTRDQLASYPPAAVAVGDREGGPRYRRVAEPARGSTLRTRAIADIVSLGAPRESMDGLYLGEAIHGIGELDFSSDARRRRVEKVEDFGGEDVAGGYRQIAGASAGVGFSTRRRTRTRRESFGSA